MQAVNNARRATRSANAVKMLEYGPTGKNAFKGWVQAGKNVAASDIKLNEANKNFRNAVKGFGVSLIDPGIDVSEAIFK